MHLYDTAWRTRLPTKVLVMTDESSVDRSAFSVSSFSEAEKEDKAHWLSRTPHERLVALEQMRQINYAYDPVSDRIQRTLEVAERP